MSSAAKQVAPDAISSTSGDSWGSLYRLGGISAILSAIFSVIWAVAPMYIASLPYNGTNYEDFLTFVWQHSTAYNLWYTGEALTVVFAVPLVLALYFTLGRVDKGVALIGASTLILAAFEYISGVGTQLFFVQEATTYNGGCTVCAQQAITGALSTGAVSSTDNVASYLAIAGVLILSLMMLKSKVTGKVPGTLGLFFVAYSVAGTAIFPQLSGNVYYDLSQLPFLFFGLWALVSGLKVFGAGGSQGLVPSSMQRS